MKKIADNSEKITDDEYIRYGKSVKIDKEAITKIGNKMKELKAKVQEEKTRQKSSNNNDNNRPKDNGGGNQPPLSSDSSELDKQIASLKGKVQALEEKEKQI